MSTAETGTTAGNGNQAVTVSNVQPWPQPGTGVFRLGAGWTSSGGAADFFDGAISDACVFYGALQTSPSELDVQNLYHHGTGDGCAALDASYP